MQIGGIGQGGGFGQVGGGRVGGHRGESWIIGRGVVQISHFSGGGQGGGTYGTGQVGHSIGGGQIGQILGGGHVEHGIGGGGSGQDGGGTIGHGGR